jgi:hypothetical protein
MPSFEDAYGVVVSFAIPGMNLGLLGRSISTETEW